ncbi:MAG: sodium/solute symporter [Kiritimatiellaceae bacterium]|nr:sodium/solute symporter [Kiritimatiellaceae bacterium]
MEIYKLLNGLDLAVIVVYLLIMCAIGAWVSLRQKHGENLFLAQHSLGATSIGLTMWGTNVGPSMLIASCSIGYTTGIVAANFSWYAFVFLFLLAFIFAPFYLQAKTSTLPEFIGKRFNQRSRELLAWYSIITILVSWLGMTLYAGGILVTQIMNWPLWLSITALVIFSAFFTLAGGLKTVANTNVFQMSLLIIASLILVAFGVVKAGGIVAIYQGVPEGYWKLLLPSNDANYPWHAILLGYPVLGIWFWCTDQSMVQSVLGAKNLQSGRLGTSFCGGLKILDAVLFFLPGIICLIIFPNLANPDEAYMTMVSQLLPHGLIGLIMTVLIAALVSTIASALNALSTVFTLDIYQKRFRPEASTQETIQVGRIVTVVGSLISIFLALAIAKLSGLDLFSLFQAILGFLAPPLSAVFAVGVLWKRATAKAANAVLTIGTAVSLGTGVCYLLNWPNKEFWPHFLLLSFFLFAGLCVFMVIVSLVTRKPGEVSPLPSLIETYRAAGPIQRNVKWIWGSLIAVMIGLYIFFN